MGFLDFFKGKTTRQKPSDQHVTVPDGHAVTCYAARPEPGLVQSEGGVLLAHLGSGSDDWSREFDDLTQEVREFLSVGATSVRLAHIAQLSDLFAPSNPSVVVRSSVLLWIFNRGSLDVWSASPDRLKRLLDTLREFGQGPSVERKAYLIDPIDAITGRVAKQLNDSGVEVRIPEQQSTVLIEVRRPEGTILSALPGRPMDSPAAETPSKSVKQDPRHGKARPVSRAPRLRSLLLNAADDESEAAWKALMEELLVRESPFLLVLNPTNGGAQKMGFPGGKVALPVYPDEQSFWMAVKDTGLSPASVAMAVMTAGELFRWAADSGSMVALNVYRDPDSPLYLPLTAEQVLALASGNLPAREDAAN